MTTPQGPGNDPWARPGNQGPFGRPPGPGDSPTEQLRPGAGRPQQPPPASGQLSRPSPPPAAVNADAQRPPYSPPPNIPEDQTVSLGKPSEEPAKPKKKQGRRLAALPIVLILVIVFSLVLAGVILTELYVRNEANNKIAAAVACEVRDEATASFGVTPLVLWQYLTDHYTNISIETAGNNIKDAKGMKMQIGIKDIVLKNTGDSKGTIGALDATISWTSDGIKETVQNAIPLLGAFVTSSVTTHPSDQTVELKGMLDDIVAKPTVVDGGLELKIVSFNTLGFSLPKETVQSTLDEYTGKLTKNYPLGIKADSVQVTSTGVEAHFSSRNASIPADNTHPCFADL